MRKLALIIAAASFLVQAAVAAGNNSLIKEYRGIFIGTEREQVLQKLGKPKNEYPGEDDFDLSETESARVFYDDKKVKAIVMTYTGKLDSAPKPVDIVGEAIEPRADGGMYKMIRVEDKGFWVSYVKTAGDNPSIMITVQALPKST